LITIAQIGFGYWGPNLLLILMSDQRCIVKMARSRNDNNERVHKEEAEEDMFTLQVLFNPTSHYHKDFLPVYDVTAKSTLGLQGSFCN